MELDGVCWLEAASSKLPEDLDQVCAPGAIIIGTLGVSNVESVKVGTDDDKRRSLVGPSNVSDDGGLDPCVVEGRDGDGTSSSWSGSSNLLAR